MPRTRVATTATPPDGANRTSKPGSASRSVSKGASEGTTGPTNGAGQPAGQTSARPRVRRSPAEMAELKQQLLLQARQIHFAEGPDALSMRRLAQEAGLSTMALYSYFPNKQALLEGLWLDVFDALLAHLRSVGAERPSPLSVMEAHLSGFLSFWEERPEQFRMIYMSSPHSSVEDVVPMRDQPTYRQLIQLERERVAACVDGPPPDGALLAEVSAAAVAKLVGYLLLVLGIPRYPLPERTLLRGRIVNDAIQGIARGLSGTGTKKNPGT